MGGGDHCCPPQPGFVHVILLHPDSLINGFLHLLFGQPAESTRDLEDLLAGADDGTGHSLLDGMPLADIIFLRSLLAALWDM